MSRVYEIAWTAPIGDHLISYLPERGISNTLQVAEFDSADDLLLAESLFQLLQIGAVTLAFQPVQFIQGNSASLYYEALLRQLDSEKEFAPSLGYVIQPLERTGQIWRLDACVLHAVIQVLQAHPDIHLGCNLSPLSLKARPWWQAIFATLRQHPEVAKRLILEVTEYACPHDTDDASATLRTLRELGCRVALDDLGAGFNTLDMAWRMQPDIVKLDKSLLHGARDPLNGGHFARLVQALRPQCQYLVAEGIETEEDLRISAGVGVHAVQGYLIGRPSLQPDWLAKPVVVGDLFSPRFDGSNVC